MKTSPKIEPNPYIKTEPTAYSLSQSQIDALARRLIPEIKKFFADEQMQREFTEWQLKQNIDK